MSIKPPERHGECEGGRMAVQGRRTDDGSASTLVVVHENDGSWTFHGLGAPSVSRQVGRGAGRPGHLLGEQVSAPEMLWAVHPAGQRCRWVAPGDLDKSATLGYAEPMPTTGISGGHTGGVRA